MGKQPKHINHELGPMKCPVDLASVDLFGVGAQEHWYEINGILHRVTTLGDKLENLVKLQDHGHMRRVSTELLGEAFVN